MDNAIRVGHFFLRRKTVTDTFSSDEVLHLGDEVDMDEDVAALQTLVIMQEQLGLLLAQLRDDTLRSVAVRRLEGFTNTEIAQELAVSERTVERILNLIRGDWEKAISAASD